MGSFCSSKPATQTTNQTQTYTPNPAITAAGTKALNMATSAAEQPFQMPAAPVAGFTPFQEQAFGQYADIQGGLEPYFNQATGSLDRAQSPVTQAETASYLNPFAEGALANMKKYIFDPQRRDTMGNAASRSGGYGAERLALTSQNLDKTQGDALTQAYAGFYLPAMQQAQRSKEMALQSAQGWANLGLNRQAGELQATGALAGAGATQQQQNQNVAMSPYNQRLAELAYPFQTSQFLAGITGGLSPAFGGTTSGQGTTTMQAAQPSPFSQVAGLAMSGLGLAGGLGWQPFASTGGGMAGASNFGGGQRYIYADGGAVEPGYEGEGFQFGGFPEDRFSDSFAGDTGATPPLDANTLKTYGLSRMPPEPSPFDAIEPGQGMGSPLPRRPVQTLRYSPEPDPDQPPMPRTGLMVPQRQQVTVNPMRQPVEPPVQPGPSFGRRPTPDPSINGDVTQDGLFVPKSALPYPEARGERDWGHRLARSPWLSLVSAGAKTMQSTKSGLGGFGEGVEAGVKTLTDQRKELRTDEAVNLKAEELLRKARRDLAQEGLAAERIAQGRYQWSGGTDIDPETGLPRTGVYRLPTRGDEEPKFYPGKTITGRGTSGRPSTYEIKKQDWLRLNPGDVQGAVDFASGRKNMTESQIANASAMRAQQDANNNPMIFNAEQRREYLEDRLEYWKRFYRENNTIR